jgi:hypothetical protein
LSHTLLAVNIAESNGMLSKDWVTTSEALWLLPIGLTVLGVLDGIASVLSRRSSRELRRENYDRAYGD